MNVGVFGVVCVRVAVESSPIMDVYVPVGAVLPGRPYSPHEVGQPECYESPACEVSPV